MAAYLHLLPKLWVREEFWFRDQHDLFWDVLQHFLAEKNERSRSLFVCLFLFLDESM